METLRLTLNIPLQPATTSCIAQWTKSLPNAKSLLNPICLPEQPETAQCEIPFKSYMLARTTRDGIGFCILFFQDAEKVRALLQAGKPIWSVHCNFPTIYNNEIASYIAIYKELTKLPTNKIMDLDKIAKDILRKRNIEWVRYRDNKGMLKMYNTK